MHSSRMHYLIIACLYTICFTHAAPCDSAFGFGIVPEDCALAIQDFITTSIRDEAWTRQPISRTFSRDRAQASLRSIVPQGFTYGTCAIGFDVVGPSGQPVIDNYKALLTRVQDLVQECVVGRTNNARQPQGLGGRIQIGGIVYIVAHPQIEAVRDTCLASPQQHGVDLGECIARRARAASAALVPGNTALDPSLAMSYRQVPSQFNIPSLLSSQAQQITAQQQQQQLNQIYGQQSANRMTPRPLTDEQRAQQLAQSFRAQQQEAQSQARHEVLQQHAQMFQTQRDADQVKFRQISNQQQRPQNQSLYQPMSSRIDPSTRVRQPTTEQQLVHEIQQLRQQSAVQAQQPQPQGTRFLGGFDNARMNDTSLMNQSRMQPTLSPGEVLLNSPPGRLRPFPDNRTDQMDDLSRRPAQRPRLTSGIDEARTGGPDPDFQWQLSRLVGHSIDSTGQAQGVPQPVAGLPPLREGQDPNGVLRLGQLQAAARFPASQLGSSSYYPNRAQWLRSPVAQDPYEAIRFGRQEAAARAPPLQIDSLTSYLNQAPGQHEPSVQDPFEAIRLVQQEAAARLPALQVGSLGDDLNQAQAIPQAATGLRSSRSGQDPYGIDRLAQHIPPAQHIPSPPQQAAGQASTPSPSPGQRRSARTASRRNRAGSKRPTSLSESPAASNNLSQPAG